MQLQLIKLDARSKDSGLSTLTSCPFPHAPCCCQHLLLGCDSTHTGNEIKSDRKSCPWQQETSGTPKEEPKKCGPVRAIKHSNWRRLRRRGKEGYFEADRCIVTTFRSLLLLVKCINFLDFDSILKQCFVKKVMMMGIFTDLRQINCYFFLCVCCQA